MHESLLAAELGSSQSFAIVLAYARLRQLLFLCITNAAMRLNCQKAAMEMLKVWESTGR
jgi:hypothetical protein